MNKHKETPSGAAPEGFRLHRGVTVVTDGDYLRHSFEVSGDTRTIHPVIHYYIHADLGLDSLSVSSDGNYHAAFKTGRNRRKAVPKFIRELEERIETESLDEIGIFAAFRQLAAEYGFAPDPEGVYARGESNVTLEGPKPLS